MKSKAIKILLSVMIVFGPMMGMAQDRGNMGDMQKRMKEQRTKLKKDLKLSKKQSASFDKLYVKYDKDRNALMEKARSGGDRENMRENMGKMREGLNKGLKEVMNDKQFKKFQEIEKKNNERRRGNGMRGGRGGRGGR